MSNVVEVRCPNGPQRLFTKLKLGEEVGRYVHPENLIEFSCSDCSRRVGRERGQPQRVLHRYNFLGELIESVIQDRHAAR